MLSNVKSQMSGWLGSGIPGLRKTEEPAPAASEPAEAPVEGESPASERSVKGSPGDPKEEGDDSSATGGADSEGPPTDDEGEEKDSAGNSVTTKAVQGAKSFGSFLYSAVNKAGKTVSESAAKIKKTVEENSFLSDFNKEQDQFIAEKSAKESASSASVPPWVGYRNEESLKAECLALSSDRRNFVRDPPAGVDFTFDLDASMPVALAVLAEDPNLEKMRFELVPKVVNEEVFWRNYFYRVNLLCQKNELSNMATDSGSPSIGTRQGSADAEPAGTVPIDGHLPESNDPRWPEVFTLGPMSRYSEDLKPTLAVMAGPKAAELRLDEEVPIQSLRVFALDCEPGGFCVAEPVKRELQEAIKRAAQSLHYSGASLQAGDFTGLRDSFFISALLLLRIRDVPSPFCRPEDPSKALNVYSELFRYFIGRSSYSLYTMAYTLVSRIAFKAPANLVSLCERRRERLRNHLVELLGTDGVLLYPSWPRTAPQDLEISYQIGSSTYLTVFNILGLPVTQVPLGIGSDGLPIGLQVVAAPMQDRLCLAVANHLEKVFGGWSPPWSKRLPK